MQPLVLNRYARHQYSIIETMEAGLVLTGPEVKSVRLKRVNLKEAFIRILGNDAFLVNANIQQYDFSPGKAYDPTRSRKLLLHRRQIEQLKGFLQVKGLTAVPLALGIAHHFIKVEIGIGKGKKQFEKREELKKRDIEKETKRAMKLQR